MKPEEIDKIFKDRLGNTSPTPPADLWNRLQARMEEEMPPQIKPVEEKKSFMWVYSPIAATLALLLSVSIVFYNIKSTPEVSQTLTVNDKPKLEETPVSNAPETIAQEKVTSEKKSEGQATDLNHTASTKSEDNAKASTKVKEQVSTARQTEIVTVTKAPKQDIQNSASVKNAPITVKSAEPVALGVKTEPNASLAGVASNSNLNAQPVEITIKRSGSSANALTITEGNQTSELDKKTVLAKNIFKQVRNLANGEQVELAELGIRADKVALGAQIGKQKFSKVINL